MISFDRLAARFGQETGYTAMVAALPPHLAHLSLSALTPGLHGGTREACQEEDQSATQRPPGRAGRPGLPLAPRGAGGSMPSLRSAAPSWARSLGHADPAGATAPAGGCRSEEHTSELQSLRHLV